MFMLHERLGVALPQAVAKASSVPAQILKLGDRGVLAAGYLADLVRVRYLRDTPCVIAAWRSGKPVA
jgi:alpha-D-ribose 1-methylphosphonate 5-triphosphate diphosphatase PhnM